MLLSDGYYDSYFTILRARFLDFSFQSLSESDNILVSKLSHLEFGSRNFNYVITIPEKVLCSKSNLYLSEIKITEMSNENKIIFQQNFFSTSPVYLLS